MVAAAAARTKGSPPAGVLLAPFEAPKTVSLRDMQILSTYRVAWRVFAETARWNYGDERV